MMTMEFANLVAMIPIEGGAIYEPQSGGLFGGWFDGSTVWMIALTAGGAALASWVTLKILARDRARCGPTVRSLARSLGLSQVQYRLLSRIAAESGLPNAGSLLISRGCFDHAVRAGKRREKDVEVLRGIRKMVFA